MGTSIKLPSAAKAGENILHTATAPDGLACESPGGERLLATV